MRADILALALLIALLWGLSPIIHKHILHSVSMHTAILFSGIFYSICTILYAFIYRDELKRDAHNIQGQTILFLAFTSIVCAFITNIIYFRIIKKHDSHVISALIYSSPVFTLVLAYFVLKEDVHPMGFLGVMFIIIGVVCLAFNKSGNEPFLLK